MVDSLSVGLILGEQPRVASGPSDNGPGIEAFAGSRVGAIPSVDPFVACRDGDLGAAACAASAVQPFPSSFMTSPTAVDLSSAFDVGVPGAPSREAALCSPRPAVVPDSRRGTARGLCENADVSSVRGLRREAAGSSLSRGSHHESSHSGTPSRFAAPVRRHGAAGGLRENADVSGSSLPVTVWESDSLADRAKPSPALRVLFRAPTAIAPVANRDEFPALPYSQVPRWIRFMSPPSDIDAQDNDAQDPGALFILSPDPLPPPLESPSSVTSVDPQSPLESPVSVSVPPLLVLPALLRLLPLSRAVP